MKINPNKKQQIEHEQQLHTNKKTNQHLKSNMTISETCNANNCFVGLIKTKCRRVAKTTTLQQQNTTNTTNYVYFLQTKLTPWANHAEVYLKHM